MGGDIQIFKYLDRPSWYVRFWNKAKRSYVVRSLRTTDQGEAVDRAIAVWRDVFPKIEAGTPTESQSVEGAIDSFLEAEDRRVEAGIIKAGCVRDKRTQLKVVRVFCKLNNLRNLTDIKAHSFNPFVAWRRDESSKITTGKKQILKPRSLNKSIRELRGWWRWIQSQALADFDLEIKEVSMRHEEERTVNVAYSLSDWELIENELLRRTKECEGERRELLPTQQYGRYLLKTLIQVLTNSGLRPTEATELLCWKDVKYLQKGKTTLEKAHSPQCVLDVRNPKGKGSRKVACEAGMFLKLFGSYQIEWRKRIGLPPTKLRDGVFHNPLTNKPYVYSHFGNLFRGVLKDLDLQGKGYTIRSARGFYATRLLSEGHPPYLVAKLLGHDVEVLRKSYDQISEYDLITTFLGEEFVE